jgi:transcriptional regulator with PAS, ATPase and Fis domain
LATTSPAAGRTNLRQVLRKVEAGIVREALQRYGTQTKAAKHLGVGQATIARKARQLNLGAERQPVISE